MQGAQLGHGDLDVPAMNSDPMFTYMRLVWPSGTSMVLLRLAGRRNGVAG